MKKIFYALLSFLFLAVHAPHTACAQTVTLSFTPVVSGLSQPLDVVRAPSDTDRLFVVQKGGTVRIVKSGVLQTGNFLDISSIIATSSEQGLLSLAFHPQHGTNRLFWVVYNNTAGDLVLARYATLAGDTNAADPASATIVTTVPHPTNSNHNGGRILFGADGYLYWSTGDGGSAGDPPNNAQTGSVLLGKMLRLDVSTGSTAPYFTTPPSNPFIGAAGFDPLVYQYGLRNPFRWSFDRVTGDMWIGDVGQGAWEEVDFTTPAAAAGRNWGWRCREGAHVYDNTGGCATFTGFTDPVYEYPQGSPTGGASITGGYVYRGSAYPAIYGWYICADYISDNAFVVSPNGSGGFTGEVQTANIPADLTGFGENSQGELFAVSLTGGTMYAISATGTPLKATALLEFSSKPLGDACALFSWNSSADVRWYALEWSAGASKFEEVDARTSAPYQITLCNADRRSGFYRLRAESFDGSVNFSQTLRLDFGTQSDATVLLSPNPASAGDALQITAPKPLVQFIIRDLQGREAYALGPLAAGVHSRPLPALPTGLYIVQATDAVGAIQATRLIIR